MQVVRLDCKVSQDFLFTTSKTKQKAKKTLSFLFNVRNSMCQKADVALYFAPGYFISCILFPCLSPLSSSSPFLVCVVLQLTSPSCMLCFSCFFSCFSGLLLSCVSAFDMPVHWCGATHWTSLDQVPLVTSRLFYSQQMVIVEANRQFFFCFQLFSCWCWDPGSGWEDL